MLQEIVTKGLALVGFDASARSVEAFSFFLADSIKILLLLFVMIAVVGFFRTYLSQEKIRKLLSGRKGIFGNVLASLFGAITPFCSCSSIPIFLGFLEAGIPLGITFSFLIASPLINEYLVVLMFGFFGWKITIIYVISGLLIGTVAGVILGKLGLEKYVIRNITRKMLRKSTRMDLDQRFRAGLEEAFSIVKRLWIWIIAGVGLGAIIHNYVPEEMIHAIVMKAGFFGVPLATILGVPIYGSCAAIVPIALALFQKGMPLGTALAFMMAISALSFPEAVILRGAMKLKLIGIFFGIVTLSIVFTGFLINFMQGMII